jgi:serine/threonine protein kinase
MLDFECKKCRNTINTETVYIGDVVQCPSCGAAEIVPDTPLPTGTLYASYKIKSVYESDLLWTSYRVVKVDNAEQDSLLLKIPTRFFLKHVSNINTFADAVIRNGTLLLPEFPKLLDRVVNTENIYFVFDYIPTTHGLRFFTKIDFPDILKLIRGIAVAMKGIWEKHMIIHLDLTPQNIRITKEQNVRIYNVGISQALLPDHNLLDWGFNIWDARYMSPEFIQHGIANSPICDIYSLGAVLFYLLTGHHPYETVNPADIPRIPVPDPMQYNPNIPPEILSLFSVMMTKDVSVRLQRWDSVIKNINSILGLNQTSPKQTQFVDRYLKSGTAKHPKASDHFARGTHHKKVFHKNSPKPKETEPEKHKSTKHLILKKDSAKKKLNKIHTKWKRK